ncbi:thioredoxin domain-containing protein [Dongia sp.]|uniref:thioredoxin domain-containing protein n=1 Tax=Dongia sp. TaxID=1977262 RepID=UPI00375079C5
MTAPAPKPNPENQLGLSTSPYLLQHRFNPVNWRIWGEDALSEAKRDNKPILLSVGYAACHWCHVMAHESFEDEGIAALMNKLFVNIKIDREERPDLDTIYQQALALLGQQGGWPLTMFLMPDGRPFWGGTYFPKEARYGRPGFGDVLNFVSEIFHKEPQKVMTNVTAIGEAMQKLSTPKSGGEIETAMLDRIAERLLQEVDLEKGGIGSAPKFPQPAIFTLLWRAYKRSGRDEYRHAVTATLTQMSQGGIYDHLGGGLARYSTDADWLVPHFEKMLYDNAEFIALLTLVWQETKDPLYEARVRETIDWVEAEMLTGPDQKTNRAFAASLDADSEGEEGRFYVWSRKQIDQALGDEADFFCAHYDVTPGGNWEGLTILNRSQKPVLLDAAGEARLLRARQTLLSARAERVRPGWDDKVLADWNGLMIAALVEAGLVFEEPHWIDLARDAFAFIRRHMFKDGRLYHAWRNGKLAHPATLDDHANLARAALALYEATAKVQYLDAARELAALLDTHFWDPAGGGYFMTADDTRDMVVRPKSASDNAVPNGNGVMVGVLARLFLLTGEARFEERARALVAVFSGEVERNFFPLSTYLNNAAFLANVLEVVIIGAHDAPDTIAMVEAVLRHSLPDRLLQVVPPDAALPAAHPASGKTQQNGKATAYLCRNRSCGLPISEARALDAALSTRLAAA